MRFVQITTMLEAFSYNGTTFVGPGDEPPVTLPSSGGSLSYVPEGCIVVRSDSYKPWENPYDLVSHKVGRLGGSEIPQDFQHGGRYRGYGVLLLGGMNVIAGHKHTFTCVFDPLTNETDLANSYTR
ncbi:hypothetical protein C0Q70_11469 [Pomacea canaliculata]|uniref:Uncharacterized protein n=1 Tax=Pomacea canaliculata TaxID=400727 RepID=A0A2T7P619_POMCA|nr:hypothetical protein C0Q70_11469 [Pomacea canaliculata]